VQRSDTNPNVQPEKTRSPRCLTCGAEARPDRRPLCVDRYGRTRTPWIDVSSVLVRCRVSRVMNKDLIKATRPAIVHRAQQYCREAGHITERIVTYPLDLGGLNW
jgi:hypothetical protein